MDRASGRALERDVARVERMVDDAIRRRQRREHADEALPPISGPAHPDPGCATPGLARATQLFGLSSFERDVLLIALASDLDERCAAKLARFAEGDTVRYPSVATILAVLEPWLGDARLAGFSALAPTSRLVQLGLVEVIGDGPYITREVRVAPGMASRLLGYASPAAPATRDALARLVLAPATAEQVAQLVAWLGAQPPRTAALAIVGREGSGRRTLARAIAAAIGYTTIEVDGAALADARALRAAVCEAIWERAAIIVAGRISERALLDTLRATPLLVVLDRADLEDGAPQDPVLEIAELSNDDRLRVWRATRAELPTDQLAPLAQRYRFGAGQIHRVAIAGARAASIAARPLTARDLALAAREAASGKLDRRIQRLAHDHALDDLVLTAATAREIQLIVAWARHGAHGRASLSCLFWGPPGTGKTMAAQVIARILELELWRVDLSQVVNKYIGETEKNLDRVFDEADATGAMLFFDEADALFAKRTDVQDAQDRYANLETAYLLQRIEHHRGLVVLASNLRKNFDDAFSRRLQIIAEFGMPDVADRAAIWQRHLRHDRLGADVDVAYLARQFALAGGDIKNAVTTAALLAAAEGTAVGMSHLVVAVSRELRKLGRMTSPGDFKAWEPAIRAYQQSNPVLAPDSKDR